MNAAKFNYILLMIINFSFFVYTVTPLDNYIYSKLITQVIFA